MGMFTNDKDTPKLTKGQMEVLKRKTKGITSWADGASDDQLANADPVRLAPSYGLDAPTVKRVIGAERAKRAAQGVR